MENKKNSRISVLLTDTLGVLCILLAPLLGWLPGPGGIPLVLAGLGLLSLNHEWAKRWLHQLKLHSGSFRKILFPSERWIEWSWDIFALISLASSIYLNIASTHWILSGLSLTIMIASFSIFLFNRNRIAKLDRILRRRK